MNVIENGERCTLPADPAYVTRRCQELEAACRCIIMRLPPEEREIFLEYRKLLRNQEESNIQSAFYSGIRVGEKRRKK